MEVRNYKEYKYVSFWKEADDIIAFNYSHDLNMNIEVAKDIVSSRLEYSDAKPMYSVIDLSNLKSVTKEAREYMSQPENGLKGILAGAFISNKPLTTVVINFFLVINKPAVPAKFFTNKEDALNWIMKIRQEKEKI